MPEQLTEPEPPTARAAEPVTAAPPESPWRRALQSWRRAPSLVRYVALVAALTVPTLFFGPNISLQGKAGGVPASSWKAAIKARATIDLREDFQTGFASWSGKPDWEKSWSIDGSGSAQPGRLALYQPSIPLTDYKLEFQAQIMSKALGMAVRAADTNNYQAIKVGVLKPGPLSTLTFTRFAVVDGREGPRTEIPIPLTVGNDTLYKLLVVVQGDHFTVTVNGVFASAWTDGRFKSGGVGFFAEKGETARVRSVHVIDKEDFLGWLCYQVSQWTADSPTIGEKHE